MADNKKFVMGIILKDGVCLKEEVEKTWEIAPLEANLSDKRQLEIDITENPSVETKLEKEGVYTLLERADASIKYLEQELEVLEAFDCKLILKNADKLDKYVKKMLGICESIGVDLVARQDIEKFYEEAMQKLKLMSNTNTDEKIQYLKSIVSQVKNQIFDVLHQKDDQLVASSTQLKQDIKSDVRRLDVILEELEKLGFTTPATWKKLRLNQFRMSKKSNY